MSLDLLSAHVLGRQQPEDHVEAPGGLVLVGGGDDGPEQLLKHLRDVVLRLLAAAQGDQRVLA